MANKREGDFILNNYDKDTGLPFNSRIVSQFPDGTTITDGDVDNKVILKNAARNGGGYSVRSFDVGQSKTLVVDNVEAIRNLSKSNVLMFRFGVYTNIRTEGYYEPNDGGGAEYLYINNSVAPDDGFLKIRPSLMPVGGFIPILKDIVSVKISGAIGDGVADDTPYIQKVLDYCSDSGRGVVDYESGNTYSVSSIRVRNGIKSLNIKGILKGRGLAGDTGSYRAILELSGQSVFNEPTLTGCEISVNVDMSGGDQRGVYGDGTVGCTLDSCRVFGLSNTSTGTKYGILLDKAPKDNTISNCRVIGGEQSTTSQVLIALFGEGEDWGGFYNGGNISAPTNAASGNVVKDNIVEKGWYGISVLAGKYNKITNNNFLKNYHRGVYLANSASENTIAFNNIEGFGSSAVIVAYGANNNQIVSNIMKQIPGYNGVSGEAAVNINTGAYGNFVFNNDIDSFTNYSIYMAVNVSGNRAVNNRMRNYYMCAMAIENEWSSSTDRPVLAIYSRPNYLPPSEGVNWSSKDSSNNSLESNIIFEGYTGRPTCAIYVSQLKTTTKNRDNIIKGNVIAFNTTAGNNSYYFFEEQSGFNSGNTLENNSALILTLNNNIPYFHNGRGHFRACVNNTGVDTLVVTIPPGTTQPNVSIGKTFVLQNSTDTIISNFLGGIENQVIEVKLNKNSIINNVNGVITTKNRQQVRGDSLSVSTITFRKVNGAWVEISRNFDYGINSRVETIAPTGAELNTLYPNATKGFEVVYPLVPGGVLAKKLDDSTTGAWMILKGTTT